MYKYQCSKNECSSSWALNEGSLNGFVLTCPVCGKGRGIFVAQIKKDRDQHKHEKEEEIIISVGHSQVKTAQDINGMIEEFGKKYSLSILEKNVEFKQEEVICRIYYKAGLK